MQVSADGFRVEQGPVVVIAGAGVAPESTVVSVARLNPVAPAVPESMFVPLGDGVEVRLGAGDVQPSVPLELLFTLDRTQMAGHIEAGYGRCRKHGASRYTGGIWRVR